MQDLKAIQYSIYADAYLQISVKILDSTGNKIYKRLQSQLYEHRGGLFFEQMSWSLLD